MPIKKSSFTIKGMTRDIAASKFSPEFAYENQNLRIIATDDNTSFGLVNEKGTAPATIVLDGTTDNFIEGTPIGQEILNNWIILFTTSTTGNRVVTIDGIEGGTPELPTLSGEVNIEASDFYGDHIYRFRVSDNNGSQTLIGDTLYSGDLGFDPGCPIESIGVYENEQLQKVYWTDGINQPRVINIVDENRAWNNNSFNFVQRLTYGDIVITRNNISFGSFAPGTIQYCFTYYNLYGQETNVFYTSPLYYVSHNNRGAAPEDTVSCSFNINIGAGNYDNRFDYLRIYSILRTSVNATPQVRKVVDISIKNKNVALSYTDTGVDGESLDPMEILYLGGEPIFAGTIAQKDNTLFLGDITVGRQPLDSTVKTEARSIAVQQSASKVLELPDNGNIGHYSYTSQLSNNNSQITYYKKGEYYRLGFQAQHYTGKWSDVAYIRDIKIEQGMTVSGNNVNLCRLVAEHVSNTTLIRHLVDAGYVRVRPVVVFPDANDRSVICQGVLNPTVYNVEDRFNNAPFAQASWFFRPNAPYNVGTTTASQIPIMANWNYPANYGQMSNPTLDIANYGKWAEFRHNSPVPNNQTENAEIQCISRAPASPVATGDKISWVSDYKECYYIDQSIVTLNSPDVEFDPSLRTISSENLKLRIVGYIPLDASYSDIDIEADSPINYAKTHNLDNGTSTFYPAVAPGFVKTQVSASTSVVGYGWKCLLSGAMWFDELSGTIANNSNKYPVGFVVYPWHRSGSLNNARSADDSGNLPGRLRHKRMSIMRFSKNTTMLATPWEAYTSDSATKTGISSVETFDSTQETMVKLSAPRNSGLDDLVYYGNLDKVLTHHITKSEVTADTSDVDMDAINSVGDAVSTTGVTAYPIIVGSYKLSRGDNQARLTNPNNWNNGAEYDKECQNVRAINGAKEAFGYKYGRLSLVARTQISPQSVPHYSLHKYTYDEAPTCSTDPVNIKYKSSPHLVISLNCDTGNKQRVLPRHSGINDVNATYSTYHPFWSADGTTINGVSQDTISLSPAPTTGYLWLGEIYRDDITDATRFGGNTEEAIENNNWVPAGPAVSIVDGDSNPLSEFTLTWEEGDTYYQRYDCLKTYPYTLEDQNSIVDILSFMCETRVNIDGRFDRNRGSLSNLYTTPETFNLLNTAYSQQDNFFTYRATNSNKITSTFFPNTLTWTKTKTMGETVDTWTSTSLASTLDLDGDKGRIRAIRRFNNDLLAFQDRGLSQILYNENIQIASTTGVPIEIANSGKVSGKRYISNHIGCVNKWSICSTPNGIYFMDDIGKDIFLFNGQLNNISDKYGFHSWIISSFPNIKVWNPRDFKDGEGEITYYDKVNGDVWFVTGNKALAFSEPLANFSSFYSYGKTLYFGGLENRGIMWHTDDSLAAGDTNYNKYRAWWLHEGAYNNFFNVNQPYYTTIVANEGPTVDKIFNNLEYRGDTFDPATGYYLPTNTFNHLETWNEYQRGIAALVDTTDQPSTLKKKFRIWRANIPRWNTIANGQAPNYRDRMRNPWLYIKLSKNPVLGQPFNHKTILHDLVVYYFE